MPEATNNLPDHDQTDAAAIILCGGQSKRMGQDKAWLEINGELFLSKLCEDLRPLVRQIVIVKAVGQRIPQTPEEVTVVDDDVATEGPLSGFVSGLKSVSAAAGNAPVWLASCDAPFFDEDAFRRLRALLSGHDAVAVEVDDFLNPFSAWYGPTAQAAAIRLFQSGGRRLISVLDDCHCRRVRPEELPDESRDLKFLRSVNDPEDLRWATDHWP